MIRCACIFHRKPWIKIIIMVKQDIWNEFGKNSKKADIAVTIGIGFQFLFLMSGLHRKKTKCHPRSWGSDSVEKSPTARRGDWSRVFLGYGYFPPVRCLACETGYRQSSGLHLPLGPGGPWGPGAPGEPGKPGANEIKDPISMQEYRSSPSLQPTRVIQCQPERYQRATGGRCGSYFWRLAHVAKIISLLPEVPGRPGLPGSPIPGSPLSPFCPR